MVPINDPAYFIRNLDRTELVIITGKDDPWKNKKVIDAQELRNRKFVARQKGYLTRECLEEEAKLGDFTPNILYTARTMKLMIDLVKRNVGIALAMENSVKEEKGSPHNSSSFRTKTLGVHANCNEKKFYSQ